MSDNKSFTAFRVYNADGLQLTLSFPLSCESASDFTDQHAQEVQNAIAIAVRNGFSINAPGATEGERVQEVWAIIRRAKINDDGSETPVIDMYAEHPEMVYKLFTHYLNKEEDVEAFERASGLSLNQVKLYEGDSALKKDSPKANAYLTECPNRPKVALTSNPRYNPDEEDVKKRKPRYLFGRWLGSESAVPSSSPAPMRSSQPERQQEEGGSSEGGFSWDAKAVKQLQSEAKVYGWDTDAIKKALGLKKGWDELKKYKSFDAAWAKLVDELGGDEAADQIPW